MGEDGSGKNGGRLRQRGAKEREESCREGRELGVS